MAFIHDLIGLNACAVADAPIVGHEADLNALLKTKTKRFSIAGSRHSQGGHTVSTGASMLITEAFNAITYNENDKTITAEAGATWSSIHHVLNPLGRSVPVQQSSPYFTIGGSISVNCHGRDPSASPLSGYIKSMDVMSAQGILTRGITSNDELFKAVVGGYGNCGVIVRATLITCTNDLLKRQYRYFKTVEEYIAELVARDLATGGRKNPQLHHAMLNFSAPPTLITASVNTAVDSVKTGVGALLGGLGGVLGLPFRNPMPVIPKAGFFTDLFCVDYFAVADADLPEPLPVAALETTSWAKSDALNVAWKTARSNDTFRGIAWGLLKGYFAVPQVDYRNRWLREDVNFSAQLPADRKTTDMLQEYFVPRDRLSEFIKKLSTLLTKNKVIVLNATLRVVRQERVGTYLSYCNNGDRMCLAIDFVANLQQLVGNIEGKKHYLPDDSNNWVKEAIQLALGYGGSYYLPYYPFATRQQFVQAYPSHTTLKIASSPMHANEALTNLFVEKYLS